MKNSQPGRHWLFITVDSLPFFRCCSQLAKLFALPPPSAPPVDCCSGRPITQRPRHDDDDDDDSRDPYGQRRIDWLFVNGGHETRNAILSLFHSNLSLQCFFFSFSLFVLLADIRTRTTGTRCCCCCCIFQRNDGWTSDDTRVRKTLARSEIDFGESNSCGGKK